MKNAAAADQPHLTAPKIGRKTRKGCPLARTATPISAACATWETTLNVGIAMTDKITIERETVELAASLIQPLTGKGDREVYDVLRAALAAQPAPAAVPLTDGDCIALMLHLNAELRQTDSPTQMFIAIARAVERAHGIAAARDKP